MGGTPKSSLWIGFSITNRPFLGNPIYGPPHIISQYTSITHLNFLLSKSPFLQLEEAFTTAMARSIPLRWKWVLMSETPGEPLDLSGWSIEAYIYICLYIHCMYNTYLCKHGRCLIPRHFCWLLYSKWYVFSVCIRPPWLMLERHHSPSGVIKPS